MTATTRRPLVLALVASLALTFGMVAGPVAPASADPSPVSLSADTNVAHPGGTVTFTAVFTNPEPVPVVFSYLSLNFVYLGPATHATYDFTGCTGDITWCAVVEDGQAAAVHHAVEIAPGATRTVTFTMVIRPDSPCGQFSGIAFHTYSYRESSAGAVDGFKDPGAFISVDCGEE
jgi:hypothetical protein